MARNPAWTEEEIILATELYIRADGRVLGPTHPDVIQLSEFLNRLHVHKGEDRDEKFRNPKGVGMKLANIRGADPTRDGGLMNGSKLDGFLWDELGGDETALLSRAAELRRLFR